MRSWSLKYLSNKFSEGDLMHNILDQQQITGTYRIFMKGEESIKLTFRSKEIFGGVLIGHFLHLVFQAKNKFYRESSTFWTFYLAWNIKLRGVRSSRSANLHSFIRFKFVSQLFLLKDLNNSLIPPSLIENIHYYYYY